MKLLAFLLIVLSFSITAAAQQIAAKANEAFSLQIETADGKTVELKTADFAKLTRREVRAKDHNGKETVFSGFNLSEVLSAAGVKFGKETKGANLASYLLVEAADKYRVIFAMTELDTDFTDKIILLADLRDGKPLSKEEGKMRLVVPDEKKQGRWVRQVVKFTIKSINSATNLDMTTAKADNEDLIRKVVFTETIRFWNLHPDKTLKTYYLAVDDDKDPSGKLLEVFASYKVSIKKASDSFIKSDGSVLNKVTKKQGVLFFISKLEWINNNEVKVSAGNQIGNLGGNGCSYKLKKENDEWKIVSTENCYVS